MTVESFGEEWSKFDSFSESEIAQIGDDYFDIVGPDILNENSTVLDMGCGTGRWTKYASQRSGFVEAVDPSKAVFAAAQLLADSKNVRVSQAEVDNLPFADDTFDFVFSLGVLHHIPDTPAAMKKCVSKLKPGGHFLVYLYYNFENRGFLFKLTFHLSNVIRSVISKLPASLKKLVCDFLACVVYWPLATISRLLRPILKNGVKAIPLSYYSDKTFNVMRNDSLDRFGTPLEQRFSQADIVQMMKSSGLEEIKFSETEPYWHAIGRKPGSK